MRLTAEEAALVHPNLLHAWAGGSDRRTLPLAGEVSDASPGIKSLPSKRRRGPGQLSPPHASAPTFLNPPSVPSDDENTPALDLTAGDDKPCISSL